MVRVVHTVLARLAVWAIPAGLGLGAVAHAEPTGSVKGTVIFEGEAPDRPKLRRDTDPYCAKVDKLAEDVIVTRGKLKDVSCGARTAPRPLPKRSPPRR